MKGFSNELLLLVLLGAFMVFNIVMQRAARKRQLEAAQNEPLQQEVADEDAGEFAPPTPAPVPAPRAQIKRTAGAARTTKRRFARQSLFGTPRQVQNAFVVATILGRCRADEPHESR